MTEYRRALENFYSNVLADLSDASETFSTYLEGAKRPEINLALNRYSPQKLSFFDQSDEAIKSCLDLGFYPDARSVIDNAILLGKVMKYPGILGPGECGYQSSSISQFEIENSSSSEDPILVEFGSGGFPDTLRKISLLSECESESCQDDFWQNAARSGSIQILRIFRGFSERSIPLDEVAWCKTARSIEICLRISSLLGGDLQDWLSKIVIHAAHSLVEGSFLALLRMSREIASIIQLLVFTPCLTSVDDDTGLNIIMISALLTEAGFGLAGAGLYLGFSFELDTDDSLICMGIWESCLDLVTTASRAFATQPVWRQLIKNRIEQTNFCTSRFLNVTLKLHSTVMLHLISRSHHIATPFSLHPECSVTCMKAEIKESKSPGHLIGKCNKDKCQIYKFKPIEKTDLVLFDTKNLELVVFNAETSPLYVAVSHVWFQGIFGQSSRECGSCSLEFLRAACCKIGIRYAWIDALCMPSKENLRPIAVKQLRKIYLNAAATLVFDVGIISTNAQTVLDLSLVILMSDWSSRVWTLQEGVLALKILFCIRNDVLALPQVDFPSSLQDTQSMVPSNVLRLYGLEEHGIKLPLEHILDYAAGRQTSWSQDYMYGLSALLPSQIHKRLPSQELMAIEVAKMYKTIDLGILQTSLERCQTSGYRWMPLSAKLMCRRFDTGISGIITTVGLWSPVTALIRATSDAMALKKEKDALLGSMEMDMNIEYLYATKSPGVFICTCINAKDLVFCRIGGVTSNKSYGFVATPTRLRGVFHYVAVAALIGDALIKDDSIFVA
ncbi:hypothetical protein BGZ76_003761 [Entomortierella beljakovae]|nr:hypothetical protein BGZ76_003761 [Entomortierella beljakovae]